MPGKFAIMRKVKKGLDEIDTGVPREERTRAVKTELCTIGRSFGYEVYAKDVEEDERDGSEWLYDVTWLEYDRSGGGLTDAPLVAECEWENQQEIEIDNDFEKLLLARAGVRVMIFSGRDEPNSKNIAERLARWVKEFNGSRAEDAWLLAAREKNGDVWRFRYFTIKCGVLMDFNH